MTVAIDVPNEGKVVLPAQSSSLTSILTRADEDRQCNQDHRHPEVGRKELWAWYAYSIGSAPYAMVGLVMFLPLILEDLAWRAGTTDIHDPLQPPCADRTGAEPNAQFPACYVRFGGGWCSPVAFSLYTMTMATFLQVLLSTSCGALADFSHWRRVLMVSFCVVSSLMFVAFAAVVRPELYLLASALTIAGTALWGTSGVFYNAYLPLLVDAHPGVRQAQIEADAELEQFRVSAANKLSTGSYSWGFAFSLLVIFICIGFLIATDMNSTYNMLLCVAFSGLWCLLFTLFAVLPWTQTRPGPELPATERSYFLYSWKKTFHTTINASKLRQTFLVLAAIVLSNAGYGTIASVAVLFGKSVLNMKSFDLVIMAVMGPFLAVPGNFFFIFLSKRFRWSTKRILVVIIALYATIPVYGLIGYVAPFGMRTVAEIFVMGALYGFLIGPMLSFRRSFYADFIPPGSVRSMESEFFALLDVLNKFAALFGPFLVAVVADATGDIRLSLVPILLFLLGGLVPLYYVDLAAGKEDACQFAKERIGNELSNSV